MSTEHAPTVGISSRRSACDRCRTQKSKCLRQRPDQARCDRCNHADSECVTSPIYRMRAWQAVPDSSSDGSGVSSLRSEGTRKRQRQEHDYQQLLTPSESNASVNPSASADVPCVNATHQFIDNSFSNSACSCTEQLPPRPLQDQMLENTGLFDSIFGDVVMDQYIESVSGTSDDPFGRTMLPRIQTEAPIHHVPTNLEPFGSESQCIAQTSPSDTLGSLNGARVDDSEISTSVSPIQGEDTPLQQLSRIDYDLVTLLSCLSKGPPEVSMDTLVSPLDATKSSTPAVDDILNRTREFVDVLKLLSEQQSTRKSLTVQSRMSVSNRVDSMGSRSGAESDGASSPGSDCSNTPSPPGIADIHPISALDTASSIAILSSYMRVLRLHLVVFAHIHDFLKDISESDDPVLCSIPGLSFCTFPIQSGNLQTIILIQVVTSLFERIEILLGLPREFRLGTRKEDTLGLFRANGFMDIAGPVMRREEEGEPHHGKGGIKCLRKHIKKTKHLLRDRIAP